MASMGDLTANLGMDAKNFRNGCAEAGHGLHELQDKFVEFAGMLGVGISIEGFIEGIKGQIEAVTELSHVSEKIEVPINSLIALKHEAGFCHVEFESLEKGMIKMLHSLAEAAGGEEKQAKALKLLGINIADIIELPADQEFGIISDAINKLGNVASRVNVTMDIFGKGGADMMNVIGKGSAGIAAARTETERLGLAMSEVDVSKMEEADKSMKTLKEATEALFRAFAIGLAPSIVEATKNLTDFITKGNQKPADGGVLSTILHGAGGLGHGAMGLLHAGQGMAAGAVGLGMMPFNSEAAELMSDEVDKRFAMSKDSFATGWHTAMGDAAQKQEKVGSTAEEMGNKAHEGSEKAKASMELLRAQTEKLAKEFEKARGGRQGDLRINADASREAVERIQEGRGFFRQGCTDGRSGHARRPVRENRKRTRQADGRGSEENA